MQDYRDMSLLLRGSIHHGTRLILIRFSYNITAGVSLEKIRALIYVYTMLLVNITTLRRSKSKR